MGEDASGASKNREPLVEFMKLFEGLLRKDALSMFETLPQPLKDGPFEEVVKAMKERLKVDTNGACVKAMSQLASLTIREGQPVTEFCLALEKLASRAYPDTPPEAVSLQKAEILFSQLDNSTITEMADPAKQLFGCRSVAQVDIMGMQVEALLDTGSETSIIPIALFKAARDCNVDIDAFVERIPGIEAVIRNASGQRMQFLDTIRMEVGLDGARRWIAFHVGDGLDKLVILGTNALEQFGIHLVREEKQAPVVQEDEQKADAIHEPASTQAVVAQRTYVPPGARGNVELLGNPGDTMLWSNNKFVSHGCCTISREGTVKIPVVNTGTEPMVLQKGQVIGEFSDDEFLPVKIAPDHSDMLDGNAGQAKGAIDKEKILSDMLAQRSDMTSKLTSLTQQFSDVFAVSDRELTHTHLVVHDIDTGDATPIKQKTRPVPMGARKEFKGIIKDLVERGIVEKSQSEWASPVVLVRKKDGTLRLCIDYRALNKVIKQDSYPLPTIDTVLQSLGGKRVFSTLDLAAGYWQIRLSEEAKPKTAFTSSEGLFQFTVLPFGLSTSPAGFQRMMDLVLGELGVKDSEVFVYIDDILIATETIERHYEVLQLVFEAMRRANLKLKAQKCEFFKEEIRFLGHVISRNGVCTDPDKIAKIRDYPKPRSVAQLRTFLGMASYYRKFILKFAKITECLYQLTSPKTRWRWTEREEKAFEEMKSRLTQAPILAQPDMEGAANESNPFVIFTDASTHGLGAVLCQKGKDGFLHPIYFASKKLSKAEKNYHVTDLEALAVVFAVNKFHFFIYGLKTVVKTDHKPLTSLFKQSNVSARVLRWALQLQKYRLEVQYVAGKANAVADALSRGATTSEEHEQIVCPENEMIVCRTAVEESEWLKELRQDDDFRELISALECGRMDLEVRMPRSNKRSAPNEDNGALSLFFACPGQARVDSQHDDFHCSIRGTNFGSIVPDGDDVISALPVTTIYSLARYFTIYENETDVNRRRHLMSNHSHFALSVTGVEKAYLYFKEKCDHVARALMKHDGSFVVLTYDGGLKISLEQLSDLANAGILYAMGHKWTDISINGSSAASLVILPSGFRCYERVLKNIDEGIKFILYDELKEVYMRIREHPALKLCIFVSPASDSPVDATEWNALAATVASYVRRGTKTIALSGPRGDAAWEWNRSKTIATFEVVREAAATMKNNVVIMMGRVPQMSEPCASMGDHSRPKAPESYPAVAVMKFFEQLKKAVSAHTKVILFEVRDHPCTRSVVYKLKKRQEQDRHGHEDPRLDRTHNNIQFKKKSTGATSTRNTTSRNYRGDFQGHYHHNHNNERGRIQGRSKCSHCHVRKFAWRGPRY
ncbi:reverse transcriptase [Ancylostoma caninum]|uniref:RNA-directed DNA polymerase n=1 Tax=Ancylostoma caninum TaxID=29170 RepID=A0A368FY00_ANCCA|nr:reverse transcriptase [Ancylostoma caninum]